MNGLKTCSEVFQFMNHSENKLSEEGNGLNPLADGSSKGDGNENMVSTLYTACALCSVLFLLISASY